MWSDFFGNLRVGLKLLACLPVRRQDLRSSLPQVFMLALTAALVFVARQRLMAEPGAVFLAWNLPQPAWVVFVIIVCVALVSLVQDASPTPLLTTVAALGSWILGLAWLLDEWASHWPAHALLLQVITALLTTMAIARAVGITAQRRKIRAVFVGLVLTVVVVLSAMWVQLDPRLWAPEDMASADVPQDILDVDESVLYQQAELIAQMTEALAPQRPGITDLYFVGFAGDGTQQIFSREVKFAARALTKYFDLQHHAALLINDEAADEVTPLATLEALKRTLHAVATRMDVNEDILFLFLSSHGSPQHELSVAYSGLPLRQITPEEVAQALDEAGLRWRVIVVSACYSGGFVDALRNDTSMIITAAAADRSSFGCSDDNELTYFGDAYFKQGLAATADFAAAFNIAQRAIEKREHDEQLTPSQPQIYVGRAIHKKLADLQRTDAIHARLEVANKRG